MLRRLTGVTSYHISGVVLIIFLILWMPLVLMLVCCGVLLCVVLCCVVLCCVVLWYWHWYQHKHHATTICCSECWCGMFCFVLFCSVLFCFVLFCFVLVWCVVLCGMALALVSAQTTQSRPYLVVHVGGMLWCIVLCGMVLALVSAQTPQSQPYSIL